MVSPLSHLCFLCGTLSGKAALACTHCDSVCVWASRVTAQRPARLPFVGTRTQHLCNQAAHQYNKLHCLPGARRCLNRGCWITCKDRGVMYTHVWWQTAGATGTLSNRYKLTLRCSHIPKIWCGLSPELLIIGTRGRYDTKKPWCSSLLRTAFWALCCP